jgi:putative ABC transport system substrate-binding protein
MAAGSCAEWVTASGTARCRAAITQGCATLPREQPTQRSVYRTGGCNKYERLPALADELVRRQVALIVALSDPAALAAKAATSTIPIIFSTGSDPVELGLVPSFNRPGANLTGLSQLNNALGSKRLELIRELVPKATSIAFLANPDNPNTLANTKDIRTAADSAGVQLHVLRANSEEKFITAFEASVRLAVGAILIASDPFFFDRRGHLVALAARHAVPTFYTIRAYAAAGGLASYAADQSELYSQTGIYAGRVLRGEKPPADLPVLQPTKFELVINLKTAKALGLEVPPTLLARADEVIE